MNPPKAIDPSCSVNVDQAAYPDLIKAEVRRRVPDRLQDPIATAVEEAFMDTIQLATESMALQKKSTLTGIIDVSI